MLVGFVLEASAAADRGARATVEEDRHAGEDHRAQIAGQQREREATVRPDVGAEQRGRLHLEPLGRVERDADERGAAGVRDVDVTDREQAQPRPRAFGLVRAALVVADAEVDAGRHRRRHRRERQRDRCIGASRRGCRRVAGDEAVVTTADLHLARRHAPRRRDRGRYPIVVADLHFGVGRIDRHLQPPDGLVELRDRGDHAVVLRGVGVLGVEIALIGIRGVGLATEELVGGADVQQDLRAREPLERILEDGERAEIILGLEQLHARLHQRLRVDLIADDHGRRLRGRPRRRCALCRGDAVRAEQDRENEREVACGHARSSSAPNGAVTG